MLRACARDWRTETKKYWSGINFRETTKLHEWQLWGLKSVDSLGGHDEPKIWLAFDHKWRGGSKALYIKDCTAGDVTPVTFCHLILVVYSSNLSITWSLSTGCSLTQEVASECRQHGQHSQHSLMFEWVIAFFDKSSKYTFFYLFIKNPLTE